MFIAQMVAFEKKMYEPSAKKEENYCELWVPFIFSAILFLISKSQLF